MSGRLARIRHQLSSRGRRGDARGPSARSGINLLPWRELRRVRGIRVMAAALTGALLAAALLLWTATWSLEQRIGAQERRNHLLERENAVLDERIGEARRLQARREQLLERMAVVRSLGNSRLETVRVFDALADTLVEGVHYGRVERHGATFTVQGFAASNRLVSALMRNLENSAQFTTAQLKHLREDPQGAAYGPEASTFVMTFLLVQPAAPAAGVPPTAGKEG